ncbi:PAS domain S-box protein [Daejeonella oryzae]|uniref:PAS domain S-box protein n=1 Tax=Daejeonella oryzae TaxID=1122943 RepID=UPI0004254F52|nr:PAS domain S-box protein [Daejeonella oryzae]
MDKIEKKRLKELATYQILDTVSEKEYDAITRLATYLCQVPVAFISFIDENRVWFKSKIGLDIDEAPRKNSFCQHVFFNEGVLEIYDSLKDDRLITSREVHKAFNYRFFAGVPIINAKGYKLGTLCIIDYKPRKLNKEQQDGLKILADEILTHLEMRRKNIEVQETLLKYQEVSNMFDTSAELHCVMDRESNLTMINRSAEKLLGYSAEESIGHPIWKFLLEEDMYTILPALEEGLRSKQKYFELETRVKSKSGEIKWVGWSIAVNEGKWYANGRDITFHKKVGEELEQLSLVASKVNNGVIISTAGNNITWVNDAFEKITGYNINDLQGYKLGDILKGEKTDINVIDKAREQTRNKKSFSIDFLAYRKDGQPIWLSVNNSVILNSQGEIEKEIEVIIDITDRKNAEQELQTLSLVASKSSTGVVIRDSKGKVTWVNQALEKIIGYKLDDLFGKRLGEVITGEATDKEVLKSTYDNISKKQPYSVELQVYKKDKSPIWIFASTTPILNEKGDIERQVEMVVDITERKNAEEQLTLLSLVASRTVNGVIICDSEGRTNWLNDAFEKITGYSFKELKGKRPGDVLCGKDSDMDLLKAARQRVLNLKSSEIELLCYKKDGSPIWLSISNTPIFNKSGAIDRQVEIINDISERKQAERELIKTREDALQLSKAKETFLSVMSHEIRTPLNAIIGMSHILMDDNPTESQIENLKILGFSAQNLLSLINDILDFTKIETGNMQLEKANVNLKELVSQTLNTLQFKTVEKGVILKSEIDHRIAAFVKGDKTRLYQILINLLGNAVKFTEEGEIKLKLDLVKENADSLIVRFEISDTGIGIESSKIEYIFDSYTQASEDTTRKYGGTGLGLAITKRLVELHNSSIFVSSEVGVGTTFSFSIEFERSEQIQPSKSAAFAGANLNSSILVVDDNEINRLLAGKVLSKWGVKVDFAENGQVALNKVQQLPYDLVLMDLYMPVMGGLDATRAIRKLSGDYFRSLPIIALTASILNNELDKVYEAGMNDYIMKPFVPAELFNKIQSFLKKSFV